MKRLVSRWRAILGWTALFGYVSWNLYWLAHGRLAPSILSATTGIPAPTTGGTRAFRALAHGDWRESLRCNPFAVPIVILFVLTLSVLAARVLRTGKWLISNRWFYVWAALLLIAWLTKLLGNPTYW
jgi:hypothetical protein